MADESTRLVSPKNKLEKVVDEDGGSYYAWSSLEFPVLGQTKLGGGRLVLHPLGFALPHYADSSKLGYVVQGSGKVGMLLQAASKEKVLRLKKGDIIPVPLGSISWWFNDDKNTNRDFTIIFLGETSKALHSGDFTYFILSGSLAIFNGFSPNIIAKSLGLDNDEEAKQLVTSQTEAMIIKLSIKQAQNMPNVDEDENMIITFDTETSRPDAKVERGGEALVVTSEQVPLLEEVGLSGMVVRVHERALCLPEFCANSALQLTCVVRGSGNVEIVGANGESVLKTRVEEGQLIVVPRFFVVSKLAGEEGLECFTIITTPKPVISRLVGKSSVWTALDPHVVQTSLNISQGMEKRIRTNMSKNQIFVPSSN
ncbi:hypothetical protein Syun_019522 [Stephania yunnanensis]|uniref:Cupin type-1 domain-containing protein n=1 Tax=Stephania yunnanensis TaxID=152371 RepID=A0AAP0IVG7_9MAGN